MTIPKLQHEARQLSSPPRGWRQRCQRCFQRRCNRLVELGCFPTSADVRSDVFPWPPAALVDGEPPADWWVPWVTNNFREDREFRWPVWIGLWSNPPYPSIYQYPSMVVARMSNRSSHQGARFRRRPCQDPAWWPMGVAACSTRPQGPIGGVSQTSQVEGNTSFETTNLKSWNVWFSTRLIAWEASQEPPVGQTFLGEFNSNGLGLQTTCSKITENPPNSQVHASPSLGLP